MLVRHGESQWNAEGRHQGQLGSGLTELGKKEAERLAHFLENISGGFCRVYASDLLRVQETLQPWINMNGIIPETNTRWREIDAGYWAGLLRADIEIKYPRDVAALKRGEDISCGGELYSQFRTRIRRAMINAARAGLHCAGAGGRPKPILVFTHGGCIQMAAAETLGLPPMAHDWLKRPSNCSASYFNFVFGEDNRLLYTQLRDYGRRCTLYGS